MSQDEMRKKVRLETTQQHNNAYEVSYTIPLEAYWRMNMTQKLS